MAKETIECHSSKFDECTNADKCITCIMKDAMTHDSLEYSDDSNEESI